LVHPSGNSPIDVSPFNSRLSTLVADSSFRGVVDELASGTPAHEIHLKIIKLQKTLNERHDSVTRTCEEDKKAVTKASKINEAMAVLDEASSKTVQASICMKKNNATIAIKQQEMATLMSKMVLPEMYNSLKDKQANVTAKLTKLADKHEVRESKFRNEQQKHTDAHESVDSILDIIQSFYTTKGMAAPTQIKGTVADLEVKHEKPALLPGVATPTKTSVASLLQLSKTEQTTQVTRILNAEEPDVSSSTAMKQLVENNQEDEKKRDLPKKKKVAGTLWKAMWMLKNTMLNDTAIMHERHQLRNDHSKTKMDRFSDELADLIAQTKVLKQQDEAIQNRVSESMAEAKAAEIRIIKCKEQLSLASVAQSDAETIANRKKARIDKMTHLCKIQLMHISDEISLGAYVQKVIEHTVQKLHGDDDDDAEASGVAATGASSATGGGN